MFILNKSDLNLCYNKNKCQECNFTSFVCCQTSDTEYRQLWTKEMIGYLLMDLFNACKELLADGSWVFLSPPVVKLNYNWLEGKNVKNAF